MRFPLAILMAGLFAALNGRADQQAFEVVSIREAPRDAPMLARDPGFDAVRPGGQFVDSRTTLSSMIFFAYGVPTYLQLKGLPGWAQEQSFSVAAKASADFPELPPNRNREQVQVMMREMLESRFHLRLHTENRDERVLKLEIDGGGLKLKTVEAPAPPEKEGFVYIVAGDADGRITGKKATMAGMATGLTVMLRRPVVDETGLKGYYTFDVKWTLPPPTDGSTVKPGLGDNGVSELMSAVRRLFGLRLTSAIGPVKYWQVDNVEHPTAN